MKIINTFLRKMVYIMYIILILADLWLVTYALAVGAFEFFTEYPAILILIQLIILYFFIKNRSSEQYYNMIILFFGVLLICIRYVYFRKNQFSSMSFTQAIFSLESLLDIVPLILIYLSTICNYYVCKKQMFSCYYFLINLFFM